MTKPSISTIDVIIPTFNGGGTLRACLTQLLAQRTSRPFRVHVIDSGSSDNTLDIVRQFPVSLTQIANHEFSHGGTRNDAAMRVDGECVVFLVQDAELADVNCLEMLVNAVSSNDIAGVFGREEPRSDAKLYSRWLACRVNPATEELVTKTLSNSPQAWAEMSPLERYHLACFSDCFSCIRRDVLLKVPFRNIPFGEDFDWAKRALLAGHTIAYEPRAHFLHSHDRSAKYVFKRAYTAYSLLRELYDLKQGESLFSVGTALRKNVLHAIRWLWREPIPIGQKIIGTLGILPHVGALTFGAHLGSCSVELMLKYRWAHRLDRRLRRGI